jgi:hypothetical protein
MTEVLERLRAIETAVNLLVRERTVKEWYSTAETAELLDKAEFTVREWCRLGRLNAQKKQSGRGAYPAWAISAEEVLRYRREGLLPLQNAGRDGCTTTRGNHRG